ncbi:MAG TPA: sulfatase [Pirellulales bacterium]|nr:sulfatase [Pirellulales bacterium]
MDVVASASERPPNFVIIFVDNLGNGDLGCTGSTVQKTPNIDRMAAEGTRLTSFYVASGVCTPSRAALMTGCYPRRVNMHVNGSGGAVLRPIDPKGLNPDETTIAEVLKSRGYTTGCFGKWHLGDQPIFLPTRQGFDEFFGIPYSDDMTKDKFPDTWPELPLMRGERVIEAPPDRDYLVRRTTEEVISFIERNRQRPFFAYVPHTMPGSTQHPFSSPAFRGKSANGDYGDSVEELDWSTGEILGTLKRLGLDEQTLVIWTSDNGAVRRNPQQGSCAPYRGFGYSTAEGAMRMPCIVRWPGKIPASRVCDELCSSMDLLPTLAAASGAALPEHAIDGHDIGDILLGASDAHSPWDDEGFCYYDMGQLQAVRAGAWKLYLPLTKKLARTTKGSAPAPMELYDVRNDVAEQSEVSAQHADVVERLTAMATRARQVLGDIDPSGNDPSGSDLPGSGQRPAGWVEHPVPLVKPK